MSAPAAILSILLVFSSPYFHATLITCSLRYFITNFQLAEDWLLRSDSLATVLESKNETSGRRKSISMHKAQTFEVIDTTIHFSIIILSKAIATPTCTTTKSMKLAVTLTKGSVHFQVYNGP